MCEGDAALRQRLEALLAAHEQPETLLATQAEAARPTIKLDLADPKGERSEATAKSEVQRLRPPAGCVPRW